METTPMPVVRPPSRLEERRAARRKRAAVWALAFVAICIGVAALGMLYAGTLNEAVVEPTPTTSPPTERSTPRTIDLDLPVTPSVPSSAPATSSAAPSTDHSAATSPRATQRPQSATTARSTTASSVPAVTTPPAPPQPTASTSTSTTTSTTTVTETQTVTPPSEEPDPCLTDPILPECPTPPTLP